MGEKEWFNLVAEGKGSEGGHSPCGASDLEGMIFLMLRVLRELCGK